LTTLPVVRKQREASPLKPVQGVFDARWQVVDNGFIWDNSVSRATAAGGVGQADGKGLQSKERVMTKTSGFDPLRIFRGHGRRADEDKIVWHRNGIFSTQKLSS
jgi:hypothetical protein